MLSFKPTGGKKKVSFDLSSQFLASLGYIAALSVMELFLVYTVRGVHWHTYLRKKKHIMEKN